MILCFSGTGNSRAVAKKLGEETGMTVTLLSHKMRDGENFIIPDGDNDIIWIFPVHSWGVPPIVRKIIRHASFNRQNLRHHMVVTCGDDCGKTEEMWRNEIEKRAWNATGAYSVIMPNTYVAFPFFDVDPKEVCRTKLDKFPSRVAEIARKISEGSTISDVKAGVFPGLKTQAIYPVFMKRLVNSSWFRVSDRCISCGKCIKACPMSNISMQAGHPQWRKDCCGCLACYHVCPVKAVSYGLFTGGKGQYYFGINDKKQ